MSDEPNCTWETTDTTVYRKTTQARIGGCAIGTALATVAEWRTNRPCVPPFFLLSLPDGFLSLRLRKLSPLFFLLAPRDHFVHPFILRKKLVPCHTDLSNR